MTGSDVPFAQINCTKYLTVFLAVARNGSFTKAASALRISQPSVTVAIHNLEQVVGVRLFDRTTRRVALTAQGRQFVATADRLLADFKGALQNLSEGEQHDPSRMRIAAVRSVTAQILPAAVAAFLTSHPNVKITVCDRSSRDVWHQIRHGGADFGFVSVTNDDPDLEFTLLFRDRLGVLARADNELFAGDGDIDWEDLNAFEFVRIMGDTPGTIIARVANLPESIRRPRYELAHSRLIWAVLAETAQRFTVIPAMGAADRASVHLTYRPLRNPVMWRDVYAVTPRDRPLSKLSDDLLDCVRETLAQTISDDPSVQLAS